jgi:hypothetical protein
MQSGYTHHEVVAARAGRFFLALKLDKTPHQIHPH